MVEYEYKSLFEIVQNIVGFEIICAGSHAPKISWCKDTTAYINLAHGQNRKICYIEIQLDFKFFEDDVYQYNAVSVHHLSTNTGRPGLHPCNQVSIGSQGMEGSRREKKMPRPNIIPMCSDAKLARSLRRNLY